jgi:dolichyl-phosphooligosaccharide-protein glycotransferase
MRDRAERSVGPLDVPSALDLLRRWYHVPALVAAMLFMFWVRVQSYDRFDRGDGTIRLAAVDSWYHWRTTMYTVQNWPRTMPYDPWTAYPTGTYVGQFGTLFDQIVATTALIVGLGDPTEETVFAVALLVVPALAALVALPTYAIGRRLGGRFAGLAGVALLALFPGTFLYRSTAGMLQHHAAEVLFMSLAVLATMFALRAAEHERPTYRTVIDREYDRLRRPVGYSVLAGFAITLYIWVWPPGVVLIGILGLFFAVELTLVSTRGENPEHLALVGVVALGTTGVLTAATMEVSTVSATAAGPLQPLLAFAVAAGCLFLAALTGLWRRRGIEPRAYPLAIVGLALVSMATVAFALPDLWSTIVGNVYGRLLPFGHSPTVLTVGEAQPPDDVHGHAYRQYGLAFYTAMAGLAVLVVRPVVTAGVEHRSEHVLIAVWALSLTSMAFTQLRFNYYYVVPVAVLNAYLLGLLVGQLDQLDLVFGSDAVRGVRAHRTVGVLVVALVCVALFAPLLPPVATTTAVDRGQAAIPSDNAIRWEGSNEWLAENTPVPGAWGGADNADELEYYGTYPVPEDGEFDYPEGAYGVMSWWDYGHLVTVQAERIPHTNPFQQNAASAAAFLTAGSEQRAELVLEAIPAAREVGHLGVLSDEELAVAADQHADQPENGGIRYVMIDDEMAAGKFGAIATYAGADVGAYSEQREVELDEAANETGTITAGARSDAYEDTMLSRLYYDDADGTERYRLVHESDGTTRFGSVAISRDGGESWQTRQINRELTPQTDRTVDELREDPNVEVTVYDVREESSVKTYERVEGAELVGTADAPAGSTVSAELELTAERSDRTFTYTQTGTVDAEGEFTMRVPYASEEELGVEEGYTESDVVANGPYELSVEGDGDDGDEDERLGTVSVPESAIHDGETVELADGAGGDG